MKIAVVNKSTLVSEADAKLMTKAVALQVRRDFAPAWEIKVPRVKYAKTDVDLAPDYLRVVLFDDSDAAGALGYHDDGPDGRPYARVFCRDSIKYSGVLQGVYSVAVVLSHEVLELIGDPQVNLWADAPNGVSYAYEVCDPVQGDSYDVDVNGVAVSVSNFVTPAWFDGIPVPGSKFDQLGKVDGSFKMADGGYTISRSHGQESVNYAADFPDWKKAAKAHPAARTHKRGG